MPPEHILEDELHAEISDGQNAEAAQGPTYREAPTPTETDAADQQHAEDGPRNQRQHRLVNQMLREQIGDEDETREQRQREQHEAGAGAQAGGGAGLADGGQLQRHGEADALTALICKLDGRQPASVCTKGSIPALEAELE